jgi:hypothetical protein
LAAILVLIGPVIVHILQQSAPYNLEALFHVLGSIRAIVESTEQGLEEHASDRESWRKDDTQVGDCHLGFVRMRGDFGEMVAKIRQDDIVGPRETNKDAAECMADVSICSE